MESESGERTRRDGGAEGDQGEEERVGLWKQGQSLEQHSRVGGCG